MALKTLTKAEVVQVVNHLNQRAGLSDARLNRVIFYLSTGAGLRVSELCDLRVGDLRADSIEVRRGKGGKARLVPIWDGPTRAVLESWKQHRIESGASATDPLIVTRTGKPLTRQGARKRFITACRCLGRHTTCHMGRHTFVSASLADGVPLADVRDAAGHSNISVTNTYTHGLGNVPVRNLFAS